MQTRNLLVWFLLLVLPFGCATNKEAREMARATLAQVVVYEEEVGKKIQAEQKYYKDSVSFLQSTLEWSSTDSDSMMVTRAAKDFQSFVSNSQKDIQEKELRDSTAKLLGDIRQSRAQYAIAFTKYDEGLLTSLAALNLEKTALANVRKGLGQLQSESANLNILKEWFEFAIETKTVFEKAQSAKASK